MQQYGVTWMKIPNKFDYKRTFFKMFTIRISRKKCVVNLQVWKAEFSFYSIVKSTIWV